MRRTPRPYQAQALEDIRENFRAGRRRVVLVAPTGAGKTFMASEIIHGAVAKGNRVLFLAHRKELIEQCSKTLDDMGVDHGVMKGNHWRKRPKLPVQVASIQTLYSKRKCQACKDDPDDAPVCRVCDGEKKVRRPMPPAEIIIIDETHRCLAPTYGEVLALYPDALVLGLTATPWRLDRRGLGHLYSAMVFTRDIAELTEDGHLLPLRVYAPDQPDLSGVKTRAGDYERRGVSTVMGADKLVGNIVDHWIRLAEQRKTVIFASSVENSLDLVRRFREAGVTAEHLDGATSEKQRDSILNRLAEGKTQIVSNVDVLVEGYDLPSLGCVVLARPTKSLTRYLQQVGRAMRPFEGQSYAIVLDHSGCVHEHGLPTDPRRWSLEDRRREKKDSTRIEGLACVACEDCGALRPLNVDACPSCAGIQIAVFRGIVHEAEGELVEVRPTYQCSACESENVKAEPWGDLEIKVTCRSCRKISYTVDKYAAKQASDDRRRSEFQRLQRVQQAKGFKPGWISHAFKKIFGQYPPREWGLPGRQKTTR